MEMKNSDSGMVSDDCDADITEQKQSIEVFCARTHCSEIDARQQLADANWDLRLALKKFEADCSGKCSSLSPSTSNGKITCDWGPGLKLPTPGYAFVLPDLDQLPPDFRNFLERDLIETPTQKRLELSKHLNWWHNFGQKLYPLSTTGDGNCLLHAASLGMWGLHDRQLTLRQALYEMLRKGSRKAAILRRWKWSEHCINQSAGLSLSEEEWSQEWNSIVALAAPVPRKNDDAGSDSTDQVYESLEGIHVFALAHVLKRPIVVVSDTVLRNAKGEELAPVMFGGIYLPLECPSEQCHRSPLVLCYDSAHFSPLVPMSSDSNMQQIIPVTDVNRKLLPVHFAVDPGADFTWWRDKEDNRIAGRVELSESDKLSLICEYMDVVRLEVRRGSVKKSRPVRATSAGATSMEKSMTIGSSGVSVGNNDKRRILNEISQQFRRTFRMSVKPKEKPIDAKTCAAELSRSGCVLACRLVTSSHEYMDEMVREYLKAARERFRNSKDTKQVRNRMSRSFSASSLMITCINQYCDQPASQGHNFLCANCFEHQKEMMTSFNVNLDSARVLKRLPHAFATSPTDVSANCGILPTSTHTKSCTMPTLSQTSPTVTCAKDAGNTPVLGITTRDGSNMATCITVEGDYGITHYFVSDESAPAMESSRVADSASACSREIAEEQRSPVVQLAL